MRRGDDDRSIDCREAAMKLEGEERVGQLRLAISLEHGLVLMLALQVVEIELGPFGCGARDDDDSRSLLLAQVGIQLCGEREWAEEVGCELALEAVHGHFAAGGPPHPPPRFLFVM